MNMYLSISLTTISALAKNMADYIPQAEIVEQACSGEIKKTITALREGLVKDTKIMEDMLKQAEGKKHDSNEIKKMQETVDQIREDYENAQQTIAQLKREIYEKNEWHESRFNTLQKEFQGHVSEMRDGMNGMRADMNGMREEMSEMGNKMKAMSDTLSTGQIAFVFEQDLALYVYPNGKKISSYKIFTRLKKWLKDKEKTPQGKEANAKWNDLQEKVSWSTMHEGVLTKLRDSRLEYAHPSLDLETAKSQIPDDLFNAEEKKCIEDIIDIIKEVNDRMEEAE